MDFLAELVKQAPYLAGLIILVWMFHAAEEKREKQRVDNARALENKREAHETKLEEKRQAHDREMNNMWASYIKSILEQQNATYKALMDAISDHERASQERYDRMGITKKLVKAARKQRQGR